MAQLPSARKVRGGLMRVNKVVTEVRERNNPVPVSSLGVDEAEQRVQQEIIEMLTGKLSKKEREVVILRRQLELIGCERDSTKTRVTELEDELRRMEINMRARIDGLQNETRHLRRDAQQAQALAERFQGESTSQRVVSLELRRQHERTAELLRTKEQHQEELISGMKHELSATDQKVLALEANVAQLQQRLHMAESRVIEGEALVVDLQSALTASQKIIKELEQQVADLRTALEQEIHQKRKSLSEQQQLQDKLQHLTRMLQQATSRAMEADRKRRDQVQVEAQLSDRLAALHSENEELKARNGQLSVQTKQQQSRLLIMESSSESLEAARRDAIDEVERARNSCREYQFRIKQLQEEVTFLTKKKPVSPSPRNPSTISGPATNLNRVEGINDPDLVLYAIPSWMRE